jgi:hypothetical protein
MIFVQPYRQTCLLRVILINKFFFWNYIKHIGVIQIEPIQLIVPYIIFDPFSTTYYKLI